MPAIEPKVVAITGASSGIGRATSRLFARRGWRVGLIARGEAGLDDVRRDVVTQGGTASVAAADVDDAAALERAAAQIEQELGPIDVWINDAGVGAVAAFAETTEAEFRRVTDVTYLGIVNGTRVALRRMQRRGTGTIVTIGSAVSYRAAPLMSAYSAAKYAVRGFTEAVRRELAQDRSRIHLCLVHPPAENTAFSSHAASRMPDPPPAYRPEVVAEAIFFAATHGRREVKVGGAAVQFALLNRVAPALADWLFGRIGQAARQTRRRGARVAQDRSLLAAVVSVAVLATIAARRWRHH